MSKRVRIVIEYDLDLEEGQEATGEMVHEELMAWRRGDVTVEDMICPGSHDFRPMIKAEVVEAWEGVGRD